MMGIWAEHLLSWWPQRAFWEGYWEWYIHDLSASQMNMNEFCIPLRWIITRRCKTHTKKFILPGLSSDVFFNDQFRYRSMRKTFQSLSNLVKKKKIIKQDQFINFLQFSGLKKIKFCSWTLEKLFSHDECRIKIGTLLVKIKLKF